MHPDVVEMLLRSPLLKEMDPAIREDVALKFETRPFAKGQVLLQAGADGRDLLEVLAGTAEVFVRDGDERYRVAELGPGSIAGEGAFFDATAARDADVVGSSEGLVAVLPWTAYQAMLAEGHGGAASLEKAVMQMVISRLNETNVRLSVLLDAQREGGLRNALGRLFGLTQTALGVNGG